MPLDLGEQAPDFRLRDQHGAEVRLADLRGNAVLLVFYPFAFSGVCTGEMGVLRDRQDELTEAGAALLAISCDPVYSLRAFADRDGIYFPLLSDYWPHGEVTRAYGVFDDSRGAPRRSSYLVDTSGRVAWSVHNPAADARDLDAHLAAVRSIAKAD